MLLVRSSGFVRSLSIILNHYVLYIILHHIYSRRWQWLHLSLCVTPFFSISSRIHDTIKSLKLYVFESAFTPNQAALALFLLQQVEIVVFVTRCIVCVVLMATDGDLLNI